MELWKPVVGFESNYEVSDLGRVRSVPRIDMRKIPRGGHLMKQRMCPRHGYMTVKLMHDGTPKQCKVHRLVLEAFVGPAGPGEECLHADDFKTNNMLDNLRWGTPKQNKQDAATNGRIARGENNGGGGKLTEADVRAIRQRVAAGLKPKVIAQEFSVSACTVYDIKAGRSWAHVA